MLTSRRRGAGALGLLVALGFGGAVATACGDSGGSSSGVTQGGDDIVNDTRDSSTRAPANPDDGATPGVLPDGYAGGQPDSSYGSGYGDDAPSVSYPGVAECASCACPSTTSYCFGGATARKDPMILRPEAMDAGPPCPMVAAGALGCTALPASVTTCAELIAGLQASYSCVLNCAFDGKTMTAYCP